MLRFAFLLLLLAGQIVFAQGRFDRWAVILEDPPLATSLAENGKQSTRLSVQDRLRKIESEQARIREILAERKIRVTGATRRLLNAVYVHASRQEAARLRNLPGVRRVERMRPVYLQMDRALQLVDAQGAWNQIDGMDKAGAGVKIAILDTGIDHTHPAFQDPSLSAPPGYPKCLPANCAYTNGKIIVARSYVESLVLADQPTYSRPDDLTPRDRVGHGTATALVAAGVQTSGPSATISGVAPKAWLGNYKIFGSPGVNDVTFTDVIIQALEDARLDGMDIAVLPVGSPALWGPLEQGADCYLDGTEPCDPQATAVENAVRDGLTVVVPAGNDGDVGVKTAAMGTINSPGTAPSAITVGATTNSHVFFASVKAGAESLSTLFGDGTKPAGPLTAPLKDVAATEPNGKACQPVGAGTLRGAVALVDRGDCAFSTKVNYAQQAGAVAVLIVQSQGSDVIFPMLGLTDTGIPAAMVGATDGQHLRTLLGANPDQQVTLDPKLTAQDAEWDTVAYFSSRGPSIGEAGLKPEVAAVGTDLYMATQSYDPNGDMWDPSRYTAAQGTSFAVPMVAGAAALVKQQHPDFRPGDLKSAVVNTASGNLTDFDQGGSRIPAPVTAVGGGKVNAAQAIKTTITVQPATISFGVIDGGTLPARGVVITNTGSAPVNLNLAVDPADPLVHLDQTTLALGAGQSAQVSVSVTQVPNPGSYEGAVVITGGPVPLRVPYLYLRGDGVPFNAFPLTGIDFVGNVNELIDQGTYNLSFKLVDRYGVPVPGVPMQFRVIEGGGRFAQEGEPGGTTEETDRLGIGAATAYLGPNPGEQVFSVEMSQAPDLTVSFYGRAIERPSINQGGVINAASGDIQKGLAPGSYISIWGSNLSHASRVFSTPYLPISLAGVSVSFDAPEGNFSFPAHIHFVSANQINVQIPWEFAGRNTAQMKVSLGPLTESALYDVPLNNYSPGFFENTDLGGTGRLVIAALDAGYHVISSTNPARAGEVVQLYANGLGPVDNTPPSGEITPASPLAQTTLQPEVTIGGQPATVQFSGLAPYNVGLYQVNAVVPASLAPGYHKVVLTIGGVTAKEAYLYID